jgi:hypothetical protein
MSSEYFKDGKPRILNYENAGSLKNIKMSVRPNTIFLISFILIATFCRGQDSIIVQSKDTIYRVKDNVSCLYGYKNKKKEWVFEPQFEYGGNFIGKYAIIKKNEKYGVINLRGEITLPLVYDDLSTIRSSHTGHMLKTDEQLDELLGIQGVYRFKLDKYYGLVNGDGRVLVPGIYNNIETTFQEGYGQIIKDTLIGFTNTLGFVIQPQFHRVENFQFGIAHVWKKNSSGIYKRGIINKTGAYILPVEYDDYIWFNELGLAIYKQGEKCGLVTRKKVILKPIYDFIDIKDSTFILVKKDNKYGVVNNKEEFVVKLKYDSLISWTHDKIIFYKHGLFGLMNKADGKVIIKNTFDHINTNRYTNNAIVSKKRAWGLINSSGEMLVEASHDSAFADYIHDDNFYFHFFKNKTVKIFFNNEFSPISRICKFPSDTSVAIFSHKYKSGLVNKDGKIVLDLAYKIVPAGNSFVYYDSRNGYGLADHTGKIIIAQGTYDYIGDFGYSYGSIGESQSDFGFVKGKNGKIGIIDYKGNLIIDTIFNALTPYHPELKYSWGSKDSLMPHPVDEYSIARYSGKYGLIESGRNFIVAPQFSTISEFNKELIAIVSIDGKFGLINRKGEIILPLEYEEVIPIAYGFFNIKKNGKTGFTNKKGKVVLPPTYENIFYFTDDQFAKAQKEGREGIIDTTGKIVVPLKNDLSEFPNSLADIPFPAVRGNYWGYWEREEDTAKIRIDDYESEFGNGGFNLLKGYKNNKTKIIVNNTILKMVPYKFVKVGEPYQYDDKFITNSKAVFTPSLFFVFQQSFFLNGSSYYVGDHGSYFISLKYVNDNCFSLTHIELNDYGTIQSFEFLNYKILKTKAVHLTLDSLFINNYYEKLNSVLIEEIRKHDDLKLDYCANSERILDIVKNRFSFSEEGILFYISAIDENYFKNLFYEHGFEWENRYGEINLFDYKEVLVPYSKIKTLFKSNFSPFK